MDYDLKVEASALEALIVVAADELIGRYETPQSSPMPRNQHRLAQAVYTLRRFRARKSKQDVDVSQGQYME